MSDLAEIMRTTLQSISADQAVVNAARQMRDQRIGALLVEEKGTFVGMITETDIVRKAAAQGQDLSKLSVRELMAHPLVTIDSSKTVRDANDLMGQMGIRHLAVEEAGKVVGIVSVRDILLYFKNVSDPTYSEPKIVQD